MDEPRFDLSSLEPFPDPLAFDRETAALTADILAARTLSWSLWRSLYRRARSAAVLAAVAAALVMALQIAVPAPGSRQVETTDRHEADWRSWSAMGHEPSSGEILEMFLIGGGP